MISKKSFMINKKSISDIMEQWYPLDLAESWDKSGWQIGDPNSPVKGILISLDLTQPVIDEAIKLKANLIITHHPVMFNSVNRLTAEDPRFPLFQKLIKKDIGVYSAHTNMDSAPDGVGEIFAQSIGLLDLEPLIPIENKPYRKIAVFVPESHLDKVYQAMTDAGAGIIGDYQGCSFRVNGTGTFQGSDTSKPYLGKAGQFETIPEIRLEMQADSAYLPQVIQSMLSSHPYEEPAYDIYPMYNTRLNGSLGMIGYLAQPKDLIQWSKDMKKKMKWEDCRLAGGRKVNIRKIAVLPGSGSEYWMQACKMGCDLLITGDLKYHTAMDAQSQGFPILDIGHFSGESFYMIWLAKRLKDYFKKQKMNIPVYNSREMMNPFQRI